jgi:tagatose-1,6-bisphosphate aldolase
MDISKFTLNNKILMLAIDHRGSFLKLINLTNPEMVTADQATKVKKEIIEALKDDYSGVLIDPEYGLPAYFKKPPYLLCIEKTGYGDEGEERTTELEYTVDSLKTMGASGIKLLIYFHPQANNRYLQLQTAKKVLNDCHNRQLPLFLEIVTYNLTGQNNHRPELVVDSVNMFLESGIVADVFKLEFPGDPVACFTITKMLKKTPWILLTRGENYHKFKEELKVATRAGATGFLAGRALWQEGMALDEHQRKAFFETTTRDRFREICKIVKEG